MATRTFELTAEVDTDPEATIDFLSDLTAHRGLHPYLVSALMTASGQDADGPWSDWRVTERPALGPIRYSIRFPVRMRRLSPTSMSGDVVAAPGCTLLTTTTATRHGERTTVRESTVVRAPALLVGYVAKHARLAHEQTYSLLPGELARSA